MLKFIIVIITILGCLFVYYQYDKAQEKIKCEKTKEIYHNQEFIGLTNGIYIQGECLEIIKFK